MSLLLKTGFASCLVGALLFAGCAVNTEPQGQATLQPSAAERAQIAPTGKLRVGVYLGSPTSMVVAPDQSKVGVTYELGQALASKLGVPFEPVEYKRVAEIIDALKTGAVDFTVTNASPARAELVSFSSPVISLELGYLVLAGSKVSAIGDVDQPGVRVGVTEGSSSQTALRRAYRYATLVPQASLPVATEQLKRGQLDAFATNKAILNEMLDKTPGARLLDGNWGFEHMAIAIPKGREAALPFINSFASSVRDSGQLDRVVHRSGLRGAVTAPAK